MTLRTHDRQRISLPTGGELPKLDPYTRSDDEVVIAREHATGLAHRLYGTSHRLYCSIETRITAEVIELDTWGNPMLVSRRSAREVVTCTSCHSTLDVRGREVAEQRALEVKHPYLALPRRE